MLLESNLIKVRLRLTEHIGYWLMLLSFGTLLPRVATSYMLGMLSEIGLACIPYEEGGACYVDS